MTTEEAIAYWEVFQREIDELYQLCDEIDKATLDEQREPVALALSALRAQQERDSNQHLTLSDFEKINDRILSLGRSSYCKTCYNCRNCVIGPCARCDTKKVPPSEWVRDENNFV